MQGFYPYLTAWLDGRLEAVWRQEQAREKDLPAQPGPVRAGELAAAVVALAIGVECQRLERETRMLAFVVGRAQGKSELFALYDRLQEGNARPYKELLKDWSGTRTLLTDMQEEEVRRTVDDLAGGAQPIVVVLSLAVEVINESTLRAALKERPPHCAPAGRTVEYLVAEALIYASDNQQPETCGLTFRPQGCFIGRRGSQTSIAQVVQVNDEILLWRYALDRYCACWGHGMSDEKEPEELTLPNAVLEALVLSNEGPMPLDYGLEIDTFRAWLAPGSKPLSYTEIVEVLAESSERQSPREEL